MIFHRRKFWSKMTIFDHLFRFERKFHTCSENFQNSHFQLKFFQMRKPLLFWISWGKFKKLKTNLIKPFRSWNVNFIIFRHNFREFEFCQLFEFLKTVQIFRFKICCRFNLGWTSKFEKFSRQDIAKYRLSSNSIN